MILILFSFIMNFSMAADPNLKMAENGKHIEVSLRKYKNLQLTANCFKKNVPSCGAFDATKKKVQRTPSRTEQTGHPAVRYCHDNGGVAKILVAADQSQFDFCRFNDGSMIDAWDLYNHHFPSK